MSAPYRRSLESRVEAAFAAVLKTHEALAPLDFRQHDDTEPNREDCVITAAILEELVPPSGVYRLEVRITARVRVRRRQDTAGRLDMIAGSIAETINAPNLETKLNAAAPDPLHVYHVSVLDSEREAADNTLARTLTVEAEAMPCAFAEAAAAFRNQ